MVLVIVSIIVGVALVALGLYAAMTQPCENGFHRRRHWRFTHFRPGGCSAVD